MPEPVRTLPDLDAYVRLGDVVTELFELELLHMDDVIDRNTARLLAERLTGAAPERQLPLRLTA
ncbi:MAG: hypothetical protein OXI41_07240 [Chloroflexota bacterium]|nr:hypothetical protein [Chloroflexota bacterium]MDE2895791.1 hypothetical protein [Chloroflexota bacterium]